jgi:hypothetical protein
MRFTTIAIATAATLGLLAATSASSLSGPQVFSLLDVTETFQPLSGSSGSQEPQAGDRFVFTDSLYKWAGRERGARVGRLEGLCTVTVGRPSFRAFCDTTAKLPAGQILSAGFLSIASGRFTLPVVGGTGAYANVRGFVKIRHVGPENEAQDKSNDEFHLVP